MMELRRLGIMGKIKGAVGGAACKALGGKALSMCNSAVDGAVAKGAGFIAGKVKQLKGKLGDAKNCLKAFGHSLCGKAKTKACGRRMIAIPAPVKNAMAEVWAAVKPDVTALGACLVKAAGAAAKAAVMGALPKSAANFLGMMELRRLGIMGKIKGAVGGAACKALGGKALSMCNSAVDGAVAKGAGFLAGKVKQLKGKLGDAKNCLKAFGHSLCGKAKTKACGRRMIAIPAPVKNAMAGVWAAVKPELTVLG